MLFDVESTSCACRASFAFEHKKGSEVPGREGRGGVVVGWGGANLLQWGLWQGPALQVNGLRGKLRVQWGNSEGNCGAQRAPLQLTHLMSI